MNLSFLLSAVEQAGIFAILALGVYITYKILDFPDLTVDGSFPLGGAVTAVLLTKGVSPLAAMPASLLAGAAAGFLTGVIHVKMKVRDLLAGIIMMTGLYSVNFLIAGKANLPITTSTGMKTLFVNPTVSGLFGAVRGDKAPLSFLREYRVLILLFLLIVLLKILMDLFFRTKLGYLLRAEGDNERLVSLLARDGGTMKILGLMLANALVSFSGSLYVQYNKAFNLTDGTGKMVIGLAAVVIGINLFGKIRFLRPTTAVVIGAVTYNLCVALALKNADANVKNLVTAALFLLVLAAAYIRLPAKKKKENGKEEQA